jgi:hypothetical protein
VSTDRHPFFSVIALSAAFSATVFVALHYVQVLPLEREVAQLKEQLKDQDKKVKISKEYLALSQNYFQEKAKAELFQKQLNMKLNVETELSNTQIKLAAANHKIEKYSKFDNYPEVVAELENTKASLSQYQQAYQKEVADNQQLTKDLSIKDEVSKLLSKREGIEEKIDAMLHGSNFVHLEPYTTYEQIAYEQLNSQLKSVNKQIELLYVKLSKQG